MPGYLPVFTSRQGEIETLRAYQAVLDRWPVPQTEFDISTSFGETHVIASGPATAPPVVLLHALFATATSWYRTVDGLSRHYRTYAVDTLGEANKSRPTRPITSLDDSLQWFRELVDGLDISQMNLVGNSVGGFLAAYYAMQLRERIRTLVLIGPSATFHRILPFYLNMFLPKAAYLFVPWLPGRARMMRRSVRWMRAGLPADPVWDELFTLVLIHGSGTQRVFPRVYSHAELARITAPTLLILGEQEKVYSGSVQQAREDAKRLMPNIRVAMIPRAHHITALAQPELVNAHLLEFFQEGHSQ